jgi:hypothetical protein
MVPERGVIVKYYLIKLDLTADLVDLPGLATEVVNLQVAPAHLHQGGYPLGEFVHGFLDFRVQSDNSNWKPFRSIAFTVYSTYH